jgi:hypothetical protein
MADGDKTEPQADPPDSNTGEGDKEAAFWKRLDERIDEGIERGVKKFVRPGNSRNGGQGSTSLPGVLADLIFGKSKADQK